MNNSKIIQYILYPIISMILSLLFCVVWIIVRNFWYLNLSHSELGDLIAHFIPVIIIIPIQIQLSKKIQTKWFDYTLKKRGFSIFSTLFMIIALIILVYLCLAAPFA